MKKKRTGWRIPAAGALLVTVPVLAGQELPVNLDSTNRLTAMLRVELTLRGGFKGMGSGFARGVPILSPKFTSHGDRYNYNDGYVLPDNTGSRDGYTWYWGYNNASQVNTANNTIDFHKTSVSGSSSDGTDADAVEAGAEIAYDRQLFKDDDKKLYFGVEGAVNWLPISFDGNTQGELNLNQITDTYRYSAGAVPPGYNSPGELPYQGGFGGPGFSLDYPRISSSSAVIGHVPVFSHGEFDGNLWGMRLGPYLDCMPLANLDIHVSGGFAGGILSANASWSETLMLNGTIQANGSGSDTSLLGGFYIGADGEYKFNNRWSVLAGAQFQYLGDYNHDYGGRNVELDLGQSVFFDLGISYSF